MVENKDTIYVSQNKSHTTMVNSLRPRQNGRHFPDIFKWIFLNENRWISIKISLKFVRKGLNNNIPALVLIMAWRRPGDKPLSEPMLVISLTHICVTRPQWVKHLATQIATLTWPTRCPPGSCCPQVGPMLAPWTLLSGATLSGRGIGLTRRTENESAALIRRVSNNTTRFLNSLHKMPH